MKFFTRRRCQQCIMDRRAFFAVSHYKRKFHKTRLKTSYFRIAIHPIPCFFVSLLFDYGWAKG
jgi:hypothetical protein